VRRDEAEVEFYWSRVLPSALRKIAKLLKKGRKVALIFVDESIFELTYRLSRVWTRSRRVFYEYRWDKREKVVAFGGVDLEGRITLRTYERANNTNFLNWLSYVAWRYRSHHVVYVFLDNAGYHSLIRTPGRFSAPKFRLVYIPRYAPECDFAEEIWKVIKRELGYIYFKSGKELAETITKFDGQVRPNILQKVRNMLEAISKGKN